MLVLSDLGAVWGQPLPSLGLASIQIIHTRATRAASPADAGNDLLAQFLSDFNLENEQILEIFYQILVKF